MSNPTKCTRCGDPLTIHLTTKEPMDELYVTLSGDAESFRDDLAHGMKPEEHVLCFDCSYDLCEFLGVKWHKDYKRTPACEICGLQLVDGLEAGLCLDCEAEAAQDALDPIRGINALIDEWCGSYKVR